MDSVFLLVIKSPVVFIGIKILALHVHFAYALLCKTVDLNTCQAVKRIMSLAGSPVAAARLRCSS